MKKRVVQLLPTFTRGDAIGDYTACIHQLLLNRGVDSQIFARHGLWHIERECRNLDLFDGRDWDIVIYHFSTGCDRTFPEFVQAKGRKILIYHNITPAKYFKDWSDESYQLAELGRSQIEQARDLTEFAFADSSYNAYELRKLGFAHIAVLPIYIDFTRFGELDKETLAMFDDGMTNFIFAGRVAPNKRQEDVIGVFAFYNRFINPQSRLFLVGTTALPRYADYLDREATRLGVREKLILTGHVSRKQLTACYKAADIFLSMSEHEGFCVPLVEAMHFNVPILAFDAGAVSETLGDAGVTFNFRDTAVIASTANQILCDGRLQERIMNSQHRRLEYFHQIRALERIERAFAEAGI